MTVLAGGSGAAKLIRGMARVLPEAALHVITNVGDDDQIWNLHVSPDTDTILYALAGDLDTERGWGMRDETFRCLERAGKLGLPSWFRLGDRDLAMHLARTSWMRDGEPLSAVTAKLAGALGIRQRIIPASDQPVRTKLNTPEGTLSFQEYFVRYQTRVVVSGVEFQGAGDAQPAPGVVDSILGADQVIIAPSNPVTSIGPIVAVPGIRRALGTTSARVTAISPIRGNAPFSGPAGRLMAACGIDVSVIGLTRMYLDFVDCVAIDPQDESFVPELLSLSVCPVVVSLNIGDSDSASQLSARVLDGHRTPSH